MRRGFTLIELMITIGIIGTLSTGVFLAVAPAKNLGAATDAQRKRNIQGLQSAEYQYLIDHHGAFAADQELPTIEASQMPVCRYTKTDASCINVDELISEYIACLPVDSLETNPLYTGYTIFTNGGRIQVRATYLGLGAAQHTCESPSTSNGSSASSSSQSLIGDPCEPWACSSSSAASSVSSSALSLSSASSQSSTTSNGSVASSIPVSTSSSSQASSSSAAVSSGYSASSMVTTSSSSNASSISSYSTVGSMGSSAPLSSTSTTASSASSEEESFSSSYSYP